MPSGAQPRGNLAILRNALTDHTGRKWQELGLPAPGMMGRDGSTRFWGDIGQIVSRAGHSATAEIQPKAQILLQLHCPM